MATSTWRLPLRRTGRSSDNAEYYEAIAWAEELIEPARAVDHPRLAALYEMASLCFFVGRIEAAVGYSDAGQTLLGSGRD